MKNRTTNDSIVFKLKMKKKLKVTNSIGAFTFAVIAVAANGIVVVVPAASAL